MYTYLLRLRSNAFGDVRDGTTSERAPSLVMVALISRAALERSDRRFVHRFRAPKMLRGVRAPWTPALGSRGERCGRRTHVALGCAAQDTDVRRGEGVWIAQSAQRNVLGSPCSHAGQSAERRQSIVRSARRVEELRI